MPIKGYITSFLWTLGIDRSASSALFISFAKENVSNPLIIARQFCKKCVPLCTVTIL